MINMNETNIPSIAPVDSSVVATSRDQVLNEIRSSRRLGKIVSSIENFLNHQVEKIEQTIESCHRAAENDRIVQEVLRKHEEEKRKWEEERQAETLRLSQAGEELIRAWEQLEEERRKWLENRK